MADGADRGPRMVKVFSGWEGESAKGTRYVRGFWGDLALVAFSEEREHPKRPGEMIVVWRLFAEERDPSRRPGGGR